MKKQNQTQQQTQQKKEQPKQFSWTVSSKQQRAGTMKMPTGCK